MRVRVSSALAVALLAAAGARADAQSLYGRNLVVNGDAESGAASNGGSTPVASIPGWTRSGTVDVVLWGQKGNLNLTDNARPATPGKNYFTGGPAGSLTRLSQDIDISSGATQIDVNEVSFDVSAYLGGKSGDNAKMTLTFQDSNGSAISTVTLGPVSQADITGSTGLMWRRQIGLIPVATRKVNLTIAFTGISGPYNYGAADNLVLILKGVGREFALYGPNLLVNGDAEAGPYTATGVAEVQDVPGWVRSPHFDVVSYAASEGGGILGTNSPTPPNAGNAYFGGGYATANSTATQDLVVSDAAISIDAGKVGYNLSAYLGGFAEEDDNATVTLRFMSWSGLMVAQTVLGPVKAAERHNISGFLPKQQAGPVPPGTRWIRVLLTMTHAAGPGNEAAADNLVLTLHGPAPVPPSLGGVISASDFGALPDISSGSLIEIYGTNLANTIRKWSSTDFNGVNAPTTLDGVSVTVAGKHAFVNYVSPGQVNVQVPDGVGTGPMPVVLKSDAGTTNSFTVTAKDTAAGMLAPASFKLDGKQYVAAFAGPDYTNTFALPVGAISGLNCRPAKPGETVVIYGVGFGPVTPAIPAGTLPSGTNTLTSNLQVLFDTTPATVAYDGLSGDIGVYQINVVVPAVPDNDAVPLTFNLGGVPGTQTLYIAVHQ